jgi:hypothetical protein
LVCPQCKKANDLRAEYCWGCYFDFIPNTPKPSGGLPANQKEHEKNKFLLTYFRHLLFIVVMALISWGIVYGSWLLFLIFFPGGSFKTFLTGWIVLLVLTKFAESQLPEPKSDMWEYFSLNPFNYHDNYNRFVLKWHLVLFLPRVVLHTLNLPLILLEEIKNEVKK